MKLKLSEKLKRIKKNLRSVTFVDHVWRLAIFSVVVIGLLIIAWVELSNPEGSNAAWWDDTWHY